MLFSVSLFILLSCRLVASLPQSPVGQWTIHNFSRLCPADTGSCSYAFLVAEGPDPNDDAEACSFSVSAAQGKTASDTPFQDIPCSEEGGSNYRVGGGWGSEGALVLAVTDVETHENAFFSYGEADVAGGETVSANTAPAFAVGSLEDRTPPARAHAPRDANATKKVEWKVEAVLRGEMSPSPAHKARKRRTLAGNECV